MRMEKIGLLLDLLKSEKLRLVILFGSYVSEKNYNDIDVYCLTNSGSSWQNFRIGNFDVLKVNIDEFNRMLRLLDPMLCTEPFLSGRLIYGNREEYEDIKQKIMNTKPTYDIISYLYRKSITLYLDSIEWLSYGSPADSLSCLSYSISYNLFSKWYNKGGKPTTLRALIGKTKIPFIQDFYKNLRFIKNQRKDKEKLYELITLWEKTLISSKDFF